MHSRLYKTWSYLQKRGVTTTRPNKRCLINTVCNFTYSRKFGRSSRLFNQWKCKLCSICRWPRTTSYFPEKFPSLQIPGIIPRFPEELCFSPETGLVRVQKETRVGHQKDRSRDDMRCCHNTQQLLPNENQPTSRDFRCEVSVVSQLKCNQTK